MKVTATVNVQTNLDVANGAQGTIVDIVLPNESPFYPNVSVATLTLFTFYILVEILRTRASTLLGLHPGVPPIMPASKNYCIMINIEEQGGQLTQVTQTACCLQLPIMPAFAFTDYRSQIQLKLSRVTEPGAEHLSIHVLR